MGEAAEASSGGGSRGWRTELPQLAALSLLAITLIWILAASLSHIAVRFISLEQESELLAVVLPKLDTYEPETPEEKKQFAMLEAVLDKLTEHPESPDITFTLVILDSEDVNAFAIPGGVIGMTRGLLKALGDEEIAHAFVLAHEIGHFKHRDHLHGLVRQLGSGAALSLIFGSSGAMQLTAPANEFVAMGYSRRQERAADEFGLMLVQEVYGSAAGTARLFEKLSESDSLPGWAYMFSTHPDTRDRLERLKSAGDRIKEDTEQL